MQRPADPFPAAWGSRDIIGYSCSVGLAGPSPGPSVGPSIFDTFSDVGVAVTVGTGVGVHVAHGQFTITDTGFFIHPAIIAENKIETAISFFMIDLRIFFTLYLRLTTTFPFEVVGTVSSL